MNPKCIFSQEDMYNYLAGFDVIRRKYFWWEGRDLYDKFSIPYNLFDLAVLQNDTIDIPVWNMDRALEAYKTIRKVYAYSASNGKTDVSAESAVSAVQIAVEKFLGDFVCIEGLDQLVKSEYFQFEWVMHLEYNPESDDLTYYRDHYIHQVRNMYEMLVFLGEKFEFWKSCRDGYRSDNNIVSRFVRNCIKDSIKKFWQHEYWKYNARELVEFYKKKDILEDYYYNYLMYSVTIVSALLHDIGYPIGYVRRVSDCIHGFLPISNDFLKKDDPMPHLNEILKRSLLFKTIDNAEINRRVNEKKDHGAISAMMLLSQFYQNGDIFHMHPIKKLVIELSALVIFDHTEKYSVLTEKEETKFRNVYDNHRLSYLFRLCDDMQEWERVYFVINKAGNILTCEKCHMPITETNVNRNRIKRYTCGCPKGYEKETEFDYRKLINIVGCKRVGIYNDKENNKGIRFSFNFDLIELFHLSKYNPSFAYHRAKGLYKIKRMLEYQGEGFPDIYLEYFLTSNPISIKIEILRRFIDLDKGAEFKSLGKYISRRAKILHNVVGDILAIENEFEKIFRLKSIKKEIQETILRQRHL